MIAMVAVVMMMGTASATVTVNTEPAADFTTGTYKADAVFSAVTFGISQGDSETLASVAVTVTSEGGPAAPEGFCESEGV